MRGLVPFSLISEPPPEADLLLVGCFQGEDPAQGPLPEPEQQALAQLARRKGWQGLEGQRAETAVAGSRWAPVITLAGLGKRRELDAPSLKSWLGSMLENARINGHRRIVVALPEHPATMGSAAAERIAVALRTSAYRFERFVSKKEDRERRIEQIWLLPPAGQEECYRDVDARAAAIARAAIKARELSNSPPNEATPDWFEAEALSVARERGFEASVLDRQRLKALNMGGLLAVGAGSAHPPRLVKLERGAEGPIVALVGKGITFDSGGISIKPAAHMDEMKYDKAGACTVLAAAGAVAELDLPLRLRVYLAIAENMPDGSSYRPGDILTTFNGKTIEIVDTDAEGRLVLADAMALAVAEGAEWLLEFSTLTGASMVALGRQAAGLYTPDDDLAQSLLAAAEEAGERLWRMPLWPEQRDLIKGTHADLKNSAERWGSANLAASFLAEFCDPLERWAHLDMAGPANTVKEGPGGVGATGYGVALTLRWLNQLVGR